MVDKRMYTCLRLLRPYSKELGLVPEGKDQPDEEEEEPVPIARMLRVSGMLARPVG